MKNTHTLSSNGLDSNLMKTKVETYFLNSYPVISVLPYVVFSPVTPQSDAGMRTEPAFPDTSKHTTQDQTNQDNFDDTSTICS